MSTRTITAAADGHEAHVLLEDQTSNLDMPTRLLAAADRMDRLKYNATQIASSVLRSEQQTAAVRFGEFLTDRATQPVQSSKLPFGRIVLPPRTGKTVIAAHLIALSGLRTTFIVPTRNLISQVATELQNHLPGVPVGMYYGNLKQTVENGVNVATYHILQQRHRTRAIPKEIRDSALVIADEAHHSMTEGRMALLDSGFAEATLRVGLTATPDYDSKRRLKRYFPELISELSLYDALQSDLLAPLRMWVAEVDIDASSVRLIAGDYDSESLGRLMSSAPIFKSTELFRYHEHNREVPALISCASRLQAYELKAYLDRHRPASSPTPALILGETPEEQRKELLAGFENGELDTIIQVGVLVEGWNSPRCKLLIDLAPSRSRVRATQKFFRVMTRNGDDEARIYILLPSDLIALPVLPTDLFGNPLEDYECGTLVSAESGTRSVKVLHAPQGTPIEGVTVKKRILRSLRYTKPLFEPTDNNGLRKIIKSSEAFNAEYPCGFIAFHSLHFSHPLFVGTGGLLLDHCQIHDRFSYHDWLTRLFPEGMGTLLLGSRFPMTLHHTNETDLARLFEEGNGCCNDRRAGWAALGGRLENDALDPETHVFQREMMEKLHPLIDNLKPREKRMLIEYFGLNGQGCMTYAELGKQHELSNSRVRQIIGKALRHIWWKAFQLGLFAEYYNLGERVSTPLQNSAGRNRLPKRLQRLYAVADRMLETGTENGTTQLH